MIKIVGNEPDDSFRGKSRNIAIGSDADFRCSRCNKQIDEGYLCEERELVLCSNCEADMWEQPLQNNGSKGSSEIMKLCPHDEEGVHFHIKWYREEIEA